MKIKIVILTLLVSIYQAVRVPYHQRQLYYSQRQNVCMGGAPATKDVVGLSVNYFTKKSGQYYAYTGTTCSSTTRGRQWGQILPARDWDYYESLQSHKNVTHIRFNQTITKKYIPFLKKGISMIATSVINNPTIVNDEPWNCEIVGDGYVKPFGLYGQGRPCIIFIQCKKLPGNIEIMSE